MKIINTPKEMLYELNQFMINNATRLPDHSTEHWLIISTEGSAIKKLLASAEMLYAIKDELNNPACTIVGQIFGLLSFFDILGVNRDNRAQRIIAAMRRDLDEPPPPFGWPDVEEDPLPLDKYKKPQEVIIQDITQQQ